MATYRQYELPIDEGHLTATVIRSPITQIGERSPEWVRNGSPWRLQLARTEA